VGGNHEDGRIMTGKFLYHFAMNGKKRRFLWFVIGRSHHLLTLSLLYSKKEKKKMQSSHVPADGIFGQKICCYIVVPHSLFAE